MSENIIDSGTKSDNLIREDLVKTAVSFLQNPKVISTPLAQKQTFLQRKGLTNEEIQEACKISGAYLQHEQQLNIPPPLPHLNATRMQLSFFHRFREFVHNVAIFSVVGYVLYKIYENYIAPFLFGKKKKSIEESIENMDKELKTSVQKLNNDLQYVRIQLDSLDGMSASNTYHQLSEIKSEVSSLKGLLLGRKQFPSVSNSPLVPPSIPAWQMSSVPDASDGDNDQKTEELEEIGSGSGSSEPEHCTKTSESSLEILSSKECENVTFEEKGKEKD